MSNLSVQATRNFDFLLSAKAMADDEINKRDRLYSIKEKKANRHIELVEQSTIDPFIIENKETLLKTVKNFYFKAIENDENLVVNSKNLSISRMILSGIQKNKTSKDFCFMLETTPMLQNINLSFEVSGIDVLSTLIEGYQLETPSSIIKVSGQKVIETFYGIGAGNKKVEKVEFSENLNDLMSKTLLYTGSRRDNGVDFYDLSKFLEKLKGGSLIRLDGNAHTLLMKLENNTLYKKEFDLNDDKAINSFLEEEKKEYTTYDITLKTLNKIVENIDFHVLSHS